MADTTEVRPFRIDIPEEELVELKRRLRATRWPDAETPGDWTQGIPLAYVKDVCAHWAERKRFGRSLPSVANALVVEVVDRPSQ